MALYFNLLTPAQRPLAAAKLAGAVQAQNGHPSTGMVTTYMLMPTLSSIGRSDLAYEMLAKTDYPSWGFMLGLGATTMWEHWDSVNADGTINTNCYNYPMNSLNHANLGACAEWFYRSILGIDLLQPGFKKIIINPQPGGDLTSAEGSYNSVQGPITSAWQLTNNIFTLSVSIPPNTTAEIHVPTTNATAITESGTPAASATGVTYVGVSNNAAIYNVGSGNYTFSSPFMIPVFAVAPSVVITATNQTGKGSGTFYPSWTFTTNGSLIAGQSPTSSSGNFSEEIPGRNINSLTAGGSLGVALINGTDGTTATTNYVTCGNGTGPDGSSAGATLIYNLTDFTNGYDLTNITVYGGWADNGRDQQAYTVSYSMAPAPADFLPLAVVNYNPSVANDVQSATRVTLTGSTGVLATNVAAVKFDFTSPASENGYCGYAGINIFGTPAIAPVTPTALNATLVGSNRFVMNLGGLVVGRNYVLESATNLASGVWTPETNFVATQAVASITNSDTNAMQKFYRSIGY